MDGGRREEKKLNLFCFFVSGLANLFGYSLMIIASEDILSGLTVPTSLVVISISGPASLAAMTLPCFFDKIGQYKFTFSCMLVVWHEPVNSYLIRTRIFSPNSYRDSPDF